ncbi:hypothetical protein [Alicyclobacillus sendaiensis]|uniref:DUF4168 domain-containing protein n=1 Tax=Alicyclobacillus sendaiensis PA2 TaxID=3029425 RepID=A0ABT6Y270_ALISE|nr:hypothetical protein [Alicyclobacillus sendaiensis]MDI9261330.1 hypothetical protein [Alicyclobacillus sendaiensis PA2]
MRRRNGLAYAAASLAILTFLGVSGNTALAATNSTTSPASTSAHRPFPPGGFHGPMLGQEMMTQAAKDLGLSVSALQTDLKDGKTVASVAAERKISEAKLIAELETEMKDYIQSQVTAGKMSITMAKRMESNLPTMVKNFVEGKHMMPFGRPGAKPSTTKKTS